MYFKLSEFRQIYKNHGAVAIRIMHARYGIASKLIIPYLVLAFFVATAPLRDMPLILYILLKFYVVK